MLNSSVLPKDRSILRDLARQVAEVASQPVMAERRNLWVAHNRLGNVRPLILFFPEGSWRELLPDAALTCEGAAARSWEWTLRSRLYTAAHFADDTVIENTWTVPKRITVSGWGMKPRHIESTSPTGAWKFDPVLNDQADLDKMTFPQVAYDPQGSALDLEQAQDLFGDILQVRQKGVSHISFHLWNIFTELHGLEQSLWDLAERPGFVHAAMAFLEEGYRRLIQQYIDLGLLSLNNDDTYHSSGGVGYSDELPRSGWEARPLAPADLWASAESQELQVVSPGMHAEFALQYEKRLLAPFGLSGYGCCEDLTKKLKDVCTIPNLRRISISPFSNVDRSAEQLGNRYIFSWKPQPAHLVGAFDEDSIRKYIQHTLDVTRGCVLEIILKDTHTCENHPERFDRWSQLARQLVDSL